MDGAASVGPMPLGADHILNHALRRVREDALKAIAWYDREPDTFPNLLRFVRGKLENYELLASEDLGERGFVVHHSTSAVMFNAFYLGNVITSVVSKFMKHYRFTREQADEVASRAVGLYVFHELFHISQNFVDHELAAVIKGAFGPDELSKLDVYADIVAAHCQATVSLAGAEEYSERMYLEAYASNITLSYNVLTGAFSRLGSHKKRRALGLITSRLLVERVLQLGDVGELGELALWPVYTSVALKSGHIIALVSRETAWEILFYVQVDDVAKIRSLWRKAGRLPPEKLIALLIPLVDAVLPSAVVIATTNSE